MLRRLLLFSALTFILPCCGNTLESESGETLVLHAADTVPSYIAPGDLVQLFLDYRNCIGAISTGIGTQAIVSSCGKLSSQQFWAELQPSGNYLLRNRASNRCLTVPRTAKPLGSAIIFDDCTSPTAQQEWHLVEVDSGKYQLRNASSDLCLNNGGTYMTQWSCSSSSSSFWIYQAPFTELQVSTGYGGPDKCLSVNGSGLAAPLEQWDCSGGRHQQFWIGQLSDSTYEFRARHSNQCIAISGTGVDNGTRVIQWRCVEHPSQRFLLESTAPRGGRPRLQAEAVLHQQVSRSS